ncbi:MAG: hypothetical protein IJ039_03610 [Clostridia bacterium]|nr:hypothetical protein [Clostridia bacterium]
MKSRKLLLTLVLTLAALLMFTISICAEIVQITSDDIENIYANEENRRKDKVWNLFNGDKLSKGLYSDGNDWFGAVGDTVTIEFKYEIFVTKVLAYGIGNYTISDVTGYDSLGNVTFAGQSIFDNNEGEEEIPEPKTVFESEEGKSVAVKKIVIKVTSLKWGSQGTHKYSELEVFHDHNHDFSINDGLIYPPTCAEEGMVKMNCVCGESAELPVEPTGAHSMVEKVVFRNGFTNAGYYGSVCETCTTQDAPVTNIGPLFTSLGYSSSTYGNYSIQIGIMINHEAIELYNSLAQYPIEFGTVAASKAAYADGNPLVLSEIGIEGASSAIVCKSLTAKGHSLINYKIIGFGEGHVDTQFFLSLYVFDGNDIYYIGEETTFDAIAVSYNGIANS